MRLYYVDDLACCDPELTITLSFAFEAELLLKFPGKGAQKGLQPAAGLATGLGQRA